MVGECQENLPRFEILSRVDKNPKSIKVRCGDERVVKGPFLLLYTVHWRIFKVVILITHFCCYSNGSFFTIQYIAIYSKKSGGKLDKSDNNVIWFETFWALSCEGWN